MPTFDERTYAVFTSGPAAIQTGTPKSLYAIILADALNRDGTLTEAEFLKRFGKTALWVMIQNKDASNSLYLQDKDNVANANLEIQPYPVGSREYPTTHYKYFLEDQFVKVGTNGQIFSIEVQFG